MRLRILRQIALRQVLPVAAKIGKRDGVLVQYLDEALGPAAMLDVGLAVGGRGREIEAIGVGKLACEPLVDLGAPAAVLLDMGVSLARSLADLDGLHRRREGNVAGIS